MFWTFTNPIRSLRRGAYTLVPSSSRRGSAQSQSSFIDEEKGSDVGDNDEEEVEVQALEERQWRMSKTLVVLLLGAVGLTAVYHHYCPHPGAAVSTSEPESVSGQQQPEQKVEEDFFREVVYEEEYDPTHVYLSPMTTLPSTRALLDPSHDHEQAPAAAALRFLETGTLDLDLDMTLPKDEGKVSTVDIVYLWVNSTDPAFPEAYAVRMEEEELPVDRGQARRWRDNGELRGAVRSSVASLGEGLRRVHVVSADYPDPAGSDEAEGDEQDSGDGKEATADWQPLPTIGQIPEWLDWSAQEDGTSDQLFWHFHTDIFRLPRRANASVSDRDNDDDSAAAVAQESDTELAVDDTVLGRFELVTPNDDGVDRLEDAWRELALPSFNSFAIESRVGWISGLSNNFILSNDDMFFLTPMSTSDFHHPLLGPVLRLSTGLSVLPHVTPDLYSTHGEWGGLQYASELLGRRFTGRTQPYPEHFPKSLTLGMMDEASVMFANELGEAATRGFRESRRGLADIEMAALASWLRVERWREALLWTYVVARSGGEKGTWGQEMRDEIEDLFGDREAGALREGKNVLFRKGRRTTVDDAAAAAGGAGQGVGVEQPLNTRIKFSSLDGHLPRNIDYPASQCFFASYCLPDGFFSSSDQWSDYPAEEVFTRLAFDRPACGDCLIDALVTASGERGLEAFLPDPSISSPLGAKTRLRLPLTNNWRSTDFALDSIIPPRPRLAEGVYEAPEAEGGVSLREWCLRLLSRYIYAIGDTPAVFAPVASAHQLAHALGVVDDHPRTAMVCINDDVPDSADEAGGEEEAGAFKRTLEQWMESRWPNPGGWERQ